MKIHPIFAIQRYNDRRDFRFFGYTKNEDIASKLTNYMKRSYEELGYLKNRGGNSGVTEDIAYFDMDISDCAVRQGRIALQWDRIDTDDVRVLEPNRFNRWHATVINELNPNFEEIGDNLVYSVSFDNIFGGVSASIVANPATELDRDGFPYYRDSVFASNIEEAVEKAFNGEVVRR